MNNFIILKSKKDGPEDKRPDYRMSIKDGEEFTEIGGCWLRESKAGNKFFSCKLSLPYKNRKGWELKSIEAEPTPETQEVIENVDGIPF